MFETTDSILATWFDLECLSCLDWGLHVIEAIIIVYNIQENLEALIPVRAVL